jgi:transglutaminase-like putative cysteine protease
VRVAVTHTTRLDYSAEVVEGVMDARLGPFSDDHQRWESFELRVSPSAAVRPYTDGFENSARLITIARPHGFIELVAESRVQTLLEDPFPFPPTPPRALGPAELADYLPPSSMVQRDPRLEEMAAPYRPAGPADTFEAVRGLMDVVYRDFTYKRDVTTVATTVAEVLEGRIGVCQDFAHVLIGLCRSIGIPARYVSGYIVHRGQSQRQTLGAMSQSQEMVGQSQSRSPWQSSGRGAGDNPSLDRANLDPGASHAWMEAWTPTHGWRGFDPTNNLVASENHIKMAIGRDYGDVPPTRGTFRGVADERLTVEVVTRLLD